MLVALARTIAAGALRALADLVDPSEPEEGEDFAAVTTADAELMGLEQRTMLAPPPVPGFREEREEPLRGSLEARGLAGAKRTTPWG